MSLDMILLYLLMMHRLLWIWQKKHLIMELKRVEKILVNKINTINYGKSMCLQTY